MKISWNETRAFKTMYLLIVLMLFACVYGEEQIKEVKPKKLEEVIPSPVKKLFGWPAQSTLRSLDRIDASAAEVIFPKKQCLSWLRKVISPLWLPTEDVEFVFIRDEFDKRDTVRTSWQRNGYDIQISQTASIFCIKLSPLDKKNLGADNPKKINNAKQLCLQIFNTTGRRWSYDDNGWPIKVPIQNLSKKIVSYSFDAEFILYLKDDASVKGRSKNEFEAKVKRPTDKTECKRQTDPDNPDWENTAYAYDYWFRRVNWWNDGKNVGFYFLKVEEGAWLPSYYGNIDKTFFKVRETR